MNQLLPYLLTSFWTMHEDTAEDDDIQADHSSDDEESDYSDIDTRLIHLWTSLSS